MLFNQSWLCVCFFFISVYWRICFILNGGLLHFKKKLEIKWSPFWLVVIPVHRNRKNTDILLSILFILNSEMIKKISNSWRDIVLFRVCDVVMNWFVHCFKNILRGKIAHTLLFNVIFFSEIKMCTSDKCIKWLTCQK